MFYVRFWGVRGSIPVPGPNTNKFGGNTTCLEVRAGPNVIIMDAGTGIRGLGNELLKEQPITAKMFFTHVHWDHIQGFPFFIPAFIKGNRLDLYGAAKTANTLPDTLIGQMNYPNFPVSLNTMGSELAFHDLAEGEAVQYGDAVITNAKLNHPGGVYGYRVEYQGHSVVFATDTEHMPEPDPKLVALARDADVLIYDAMYTTDEYNGAVGISRVGWGHSTWPEGIKVAKAAGAKKLVLFHHDPEHDDEAIRQIEAEAQQHLPGTIAAYEGLTIKLIP